MVAGGQLEQMLRCVGVELLVYVLWVGGIRDGVGACVGIAAVGLSPSAVRVANTRRMNGEQVPAAN